MNLEIAPQQMYDPLFCYKPRRLETYVYAPRTKFPPTWQGAQRFVKALIVGRIGRPPYYRQWDFQATRRYQAAYKALRAQIQAEDYPINP